MMHDNPFRLKIARDSHMDRRVKKFRRFIWDISDDLGEIVAVVIALILVVGGIVVLWLAAVQIEQWIKR